MISCFFQLVFLNNFKICFWTRLWRKQGNNFHFQPNTDHIIRQNHQTCDILWKLYDMRWFPKTVLFLRSGVVCIYVNLKGSPDFFTAGKPPKNLTFVYQMMSIENRFAQHIFEQESCYTVFPSHWKMGNHRNVSTRTWKQVRRFCWTIFKFVRNWIICVLSYFVFLQQCCPPWKKWR